MMRLLSGLLVLCMMSPALRAEGAGAGEGGIGGDAERTETVAGGRSRVDSARTRALEWFIRAAMKQGKPEECVKWLLASVDADPASGAALGLLAGYLEDPQLRPQVVDGVFQAAEAHPQYPRLVSAALELAFRFGGPVDRAAALVRAAVAAQPAPETLSAADRAVYWQLAAQEGRALLRDGRLEDGDALFSRLLDRPGVAERRELLAPAAEFYYFAARRADRRRGWFGLGASQRDRLTEKGEEVRRDLDRDTAQLTEFGDLANRAFLELRTGRPDAARALERKLGERFPEQPDAVFARARILYLLRDYAGALALLEPLVKAHPQAVIFWQLAMEAALRAGAYDRLDELARLRLKDDPQNAVAQAATVESRIRLRQFDEAEKRLATVGDPELREALRQSTAMAAGRFDQELARLRAAAGKLGRQDDPLNVYLGLLVLAEKRRDPALLDECWKKFAETHELENPVVANSLGYVAAELGVRLPEAAALIRSALERDPENSAYLDSMAWVLFRQGEYADAADFIRRALTAPDLDEGRGILLEHAGDIMEKLGDSDAALAYYREALTAEKHDPETPAARLAEKIRTLDAAR